MTLVLARQTSNSVMSVSSRFAETRFAEIRVRGWCLPDSPKPDLPKPVSPKLGFRVRVRVGVSANRVSANRD